MWEFFRIRELMILRFFFTFGGVDGMMPWDAAAVCLSVCFLLLLLLLLFGCVAFSVVALSCLCELCEREGGRMTTRATSAAALLLHDGKLNFNAPAGSQTPQKQVQGQKQCICVINTASNNIWLLFGTAN